MLRRPILTLTFAIALLLHGTCETWCITAHCFEEAAQAVQAPTPTCHHKTPEPQPRKDCNHGTSIEVKPALIKSVPLTAPQLAVMPHVLVIPQVGASFEPAFDAIVKVEIASPPLLIQFRI